MPDTHDMDKIDSERDQSRYSLNDLIYLMQRLRDPKDGCPWDLDQTYETIVPSTIEEAYEVADAIERKDYAALKEELGDFVFQAVFYSQLASEQKLFDLEDVVDGLVAKLVRRHPHVFPLGTLQSRKGDELEDSDGQQSIGQRWEELKQQERETKGMTGVFDDVPSALPALSRSQKLQKRAARVGFDWESIAPVFDKIQEEILEVKDAIAEANSESIEEEIGDLLFSCVNLARHLKIDAETALRRSGSKFERRFASMERIQRNADSDVKSAFENKTADQLEALWESAKAEEKRVPEKVITSK